MGDDKHKDGELFAAWFDALGSEIVACADVLRRAAPKLDPKATRLRKALHNTPAGRGKLTVTAKGLGHYLSRCWKATDEGTQPVDGFRLEREWDSRTKRSLWRVVNEHAEYQHTQSLIRSTRERMKHDRLGVAERLLREKPPRRVDLDKGIDKAANEAAQTAIERAEAERQQQQKRRQTELITIVAPAYGSFRSEEKARRLLPQFDRYDDADVTYLKGGRCAIRISPPFDEKQLRIDAERVGLTVQQDVKAAVLNRPDRSVRPLPEIGYDPAAKFVMRARADDPARSGPTVQVDPFLKFNWEIF